MLMSSGWASTIQAKQLNVPHDEFSETLFFSIRTPSPAWNESDPICWTTSSV